MRLPFALRLLLALSLALVSAHTAVGRASLAGALRVELCAADGVRVLVPGGGDAPSARHFACPDCVLGGLAVVPGAQGRATVLRTRAGRLSRPRGRAGRPARPPVARRARDPPPGA